MTRKPDPPPPGAAAVGMVERLLAEAAARGASDLHLDPDDEGLVAGVRVDGVLEPAGRVPPELASRVVGRLKALADLLSYRTDLPQEGRIPAERTGIGREVRVATFPALGGERVAVRFDVPDRAPDLVDLGLPEGALQDLTAALARPDGVILVTGPSGSGKTTTLYTALRHVVATPPRRAVLTVEDPVERRIAGVTQTAVDRAAGLDFARALRSLLRQDPDVLLVGEIRDRETAQVALEAGLTGHLVLSTIHAGTATDVFARLLEMGVEPFVLTSTVRGVLAQRLLRRTCDVCADGPERTSCERCRGSGYAGRVLAAEWLTVSPEVRRVVLERGDSERLAEAARKDGLVSLHAGVDDLVRRGLTTPTEAARVLGGPR